MCDGLELSTTAPLGNVVTLTKPVSLWSLSLAAAALFVAFGATPTATATDATAMAAPAATAAATWAVVEEPARA